MARSDKTPLKHNYPMHHPTLNTTSIQRFTFGKIYVIPHSEDLRKKVESRIFCQTSVVKIKKKLENSNVLFYHFTLTFQKLTLLYAEIST